MKKAEFTSRIEGTYRAYETALEALNDAQLLQPGICGDWSIKDVVAHITWYEREMVSVLSARALLGSALWNVTLEQRNFSIFAENKDRPLEDILIDSREIHQGVMDLTKGLTEEDLLEASRFRKMPPDWIPWEVIASNTFEHYPVHTADIRKAFPK